MQDLSNIETGAFEKYYSQNLTPECIFGVGNNPYFGMAAYVEELQIPRQDEILNQRFGGGARAIEGYMNLLHDSFVNGSFDKFISEIVSRPYNVTPASSSARDEYVAQFVREVIKHLGVESKQNQGKKSLVFNSDGYNQVSSSLAEAYILGLSGLGINAWSKVGKYLIPTSLEAIDPRRLEMTFSHDGDVVPRLATWQDGHVGIELPARTLVLHRYWSTKSSTDVWGCGLGRSLYPLVEFRRNIMALWLQYCDKHTTPNVIGSFEPGLSKEDYNNLKESMKKLGQQTWMLVPKEVSINYLTPGSSAPGVYQSLINYIDQQIAFLITGERDPAQSGQATGSLAAQDRLADSTRVKKAKLFNDGLESTINNTLVRWLVELNFGFNVTPPILSRNFNDLNDRSNAQAILGTVSTLKGLGLEIGDLDWLKEKLDIPSLQYSQEVIQNSQGKTLPTEGDNQENQPLEKTNSEIQQIEGGLPQQQFAEENNRVDGKITASAVASFLDVPLEKLLESLGLISGDDLVDLESLLENADNPQLIQKYQTPKQQGSDFFFSLDSSLHSSDDPVKDFPDDKSSSMERAKLDLTSSLKGVPQILGFDQLSSLSKPFEYPSLLSNIDESTPVYEILYNCQTAISQIRASLRGAIAPSLSSAEQLKLDSLEFKVKQLLSVYRDRNVRHSSFILRENLKEFAFSLGEGYVNSRFQYQIPK